MSRSAYRHKHTLYCPIKGCNYTSRTWNAGFPWKISVKKSVSSTKCPIHQTILTAFKLTL